MSQAEGCVCVCVCVCMGSGTVNFGSMHATDGELRGTVWAYSNEI